MNVQTEPTITEKKTELSFAIIKRSLRKHVNIPHIEGLITIDEEYTYPNFNSYRYYDSVCRG